jgi:four helix bundle protein
VNSEQGGSRKLGPPCVQIASDRAIGFATLAYEMRDHTTLKAWQEAHAVSLAVIELAKTAWKPYVSALFSQLQRASLSVQLNISEGYTFGDSPTFTRHLGVAYGSAVETGELLRMLTESGVIQPPGVPEVQKRNAHCQRLILGLLKRRRTLP